MPIWADLPGGCLQCRRIAAIAWLSEAPCADEFEVRHVWQQLPLLLFRPQQICRRHSYTVHPQPRVHMQNDTRLCAMGRECVPMVSMASEL